MPIGGTYKPLALLGVLETLVTLPTEGREAMTFSNSVSIALRPTQRICACAKFSNTTNVGKKLECLIKCVVMSRSPSSSHYALLVT